MGTALAHLLRADAEAAAALDSEAGKPAVLRSPSWSPQDQAATGDGPGPVRVAGPARYRAGTTRRRRDRGIGPAARRTAGRSGPRDRQQASCGRQAGITAGVAPRRTHRFQPGLNALARMISSELAGAGERSRGKAGLPGQPGRAPGPPTAAHLGSRRGAAWSGGQRAVPVVRCAQASCCSVDPHLGRRRAQRQGCQPVHLRRPPVHEHR
jgi:hypothetical protein